MRQTGSLTAERGIEMSLKGGPSAFGAARRRVERLCRSSGFSPPRVLEILTALIEALSNAHIHGNSKDPRARIDLRVRVESGGLVMDVHDSGSRIL